MTGKRFASEIIKWLERNEFPEGIEDVKIALAKNDKELEKLPHLKGYQYWSIHTAGVFGLAGFMSFHGTRMGKETWFLVYEMLTGQRWIGIIGP